MLLGVPLLLPCFFSCCCCCFLFASVLSGSSLSCLVCLVASLLFSFVLSLECACYGSPIRIWITLCFFCGFSGPCLWAPGRGEPGFRGGPCPGLVVLLLFTVILDFRFKLRLTVSRAKRASPKFMKMVCFGFLRLYD